MRIGIDINKALPARDGVGHYTAELLKALAAATHEELFVYDLCQPLDPQRLDEQFPELRKRLVPRHGPAGDDGLDVFHSTGWAFPQECSCPSVFTCHDLTFLTHPEHHIVTTKVHCLLGTLRARLAGATFLAVSHATARELEVQLRIPASHVRVIHEAAAECFVPRDIDEARERLHERLGIDGPFLLSVATLEPRKNLRRLLEAYAGLPEDLRLRYPLLLAGGAGWKNAVAGVERYETVRLLGYVDRDDLVDLYSAATVFAYPSLAEGFGLPVVEAMACGAPVLTSDVSSMPEVAGDAARLVDPLDTDAIRRGLHDLLTDPDGRELLRGRGVDRASSFSWDRTARRTLELYGEIAGTGSWQCM